MFDVKWEGLEQLEDIAKKMAMIRPERIHEESLRAAHDFGQIVYDQLMAWMESGRPDWPSLSDATIMLRGSREEKNTPHSGERTASGSSNQPLVDQGDFKRAIQLATDSTGSCVGILIPNSDKGKDMQMIAQIMEGGAAIPVTEKMRNYLAAKGIHLRKTTRVIVIPARPLFGPAADILDEKLSEWLKPYEDALLAEIGLEA